MKKLKFILAAVVSFALILPLMKIVNFPVKIKANIPFEKSKSGSENCVHSCNGL